MYLQNYSRLLNIEKLRKEKEKLRQICRIFRKKRKSMVAHAGLKQCSN